MSTFLASLAQPGRWALPLMVSMLCLQGGCKKKQQAASKDPGAAPKTQADQVQESDPAQTPAKQAVKQIPDPSSVKAAASQYWKGDYEEMVKALESQLGAWTAPNQQRAAGLAHGWIALAHAEQLPENAQAHVEQALEIAKALPDAQVEALAEIAAALSLVAMSDAKGAQTKLSALSTPQDTEVERLLHIANAKTAINLAFDERDRLAHPEKLVEAEQQYRMIHPSTEPHANAVMGHVHEGMAAIAKFKGDMAMMCEQAKKAEQAYQEGEASDLLQSGPMQMITAGGCK